MDIFEVAVHYSSLDTQEVEAGVDELEGID